VTFFAAVEGLPLDAEAIELFCACTGRNAYLPQVHVEATGIIGRRGEKSSTAIKYLLWKSLYGGFETQFTAIVVQEPGTAHRIVAGSNYRPGHESRP